MPQNNFMKFNTPNEKTKKTKLDKITICILLTNCIAAMNGLDAGEICSFIVLFYHSI